MSLQTGEARGQTKRAERWIGDVRGQSPVSSLQSQKAGPTFGAVKQCGVTGQAAGEEKREQRCQLSSPPPRQPHLKQGDILQIF